MHFPLYLPTNWSNILEAKFSYIFGNNPPKPYMDLWIFSQPPIEYLPGIADNILTRSGCVQKSYL